MLTPYLAGATEAELEDWGPLDEATGPEMATRVPGAALLKASMAAAASVSEFLTKPHFCSASLTSVAAFSMLLSRELLFRLPFTNAQLAYS